MTPARLERTGIADALLVWAILAVVALEVLVTYTRTPVQELYHAHTGGIAEGAGRTLAFVGFPIGPAALAVLPVAVDRARPRHAVLAATAATALAVAVLWPGALDEAGLDAAPARALAAVGVSLSLAMTLAAWHATGAGSLGREHGDIARIVTAALLFAVALPWMAADLGLSLDHVPVLRSVFLTDQLAAQPSRPGLHTAVHDGHHHGMDGILLAWTALLASRTLPHLRHAWARTALTAYPALLLVYGIANAVQDAWTEQIVKRGWTSYEIPTLLVPTAHAAWLYILAASLIIALLFAWSAGRSLPTRPTQPAVDRV